jgi:alpha-1,6-mannosyltransferase
MPLKILTKLARLHQYFSQLIPDYNRQILYIGIASGILYFVVYQTVEAIYLNGFHLDVVGVVSQDFPANHINLIWELTGYYVSIVILFILYFWLLRLCYHSQLSNRRVSNLVLIFPIVFNIGLIFVRPYLSIDIFSYIGHGYLGITPGNNPYVNAVKELANMPFGQQLSSWGWRPDHGITPYGPLWTQFEVAVVRFAQHVQTDIILLKSLVVAASLISAALIWQILGKIDSKVQLLGTVTYLWNPTVIIEFAAEGHNDALMIVFTLFALLLTINLRPATSVLMLMLGVLAKYLPLIFLPTFLAYYWRTYRTTKERSQNFVRILFGLAMGLGVSILLYQQFWVGTNTFQGVIQSSQQSYLSMSFLLLRFLELLHLGSPADTLTLMILKVLFLFSVFVATIRTVDGKSLLRSCANIALVYLLIASPFYWPWYTILPLALMALSPYGNFQLMSFVLTFCSRLVAPIEIIRANSLINPKFGMLITILVGVLVPLFIFITERREVFHREEYT